MDAIESPLQAGAGALNYHDDFDTDTVQNAGLHMAVAQTVVEGNIMAAAADSAFVIGKQTGNIQKKMQEAGMTNFSAYCREQLVKGEVRHYDFQVLKEQAAYIGRIAGSINQIAKRCNENKSIHTNDVEQLRREFLALKADYLERVVKLLRKIY